ncbi:hypothetical protein K7W42_20440 [Deinococcus sp. HMF7604]|uniref:hypothetical protein n=1 Tax=Deinococcus betulae TaxID=2873312 RepID=UPI001CCEE72C|nr:hypothetical protein [Deinococcus betulae]MBZ9753209.1 hypothetical protein [Deinococcus betulae]
MSPQQQTEFARFVRQRLPLKEGHRELHVYALTEFSAQVLKLPGLLHWRGLSVEQAQQVMQACKPWPVILGRS